MLGAALGDAAQLDTAKSAEFMNELRERLGQLPEEADRELTKLTESHEPFVQDDEDGACRSNLAQLLDLTFHRLRRCVGYLRIVTQLAIQPANRTRPTCKLLCQHDKDGILIHRRCRLVISGC